MDDAAGRRLQPETHHGPWHPSRVTCREFADFIMDYLSGELPFESRRRFVRHLRLCPNCCRYLASYEQTVKLGKHAFADDAAPVPPDVPEDFVKAVLDARRFA